MKGGVYRMLTRKRYADKIVDCSSLYKGYKDLNEYLQNKFL